MTPSELLDYCESQLEVARQELAKASASGTTDQDAEEAMRTASVLVRDARRKVGTPICSGDLYCVDYPLRTCMAGLHATCSKHSSTCYECDPLEFLPQS